jgi:hypothetical protein
MPSDTMTNVSTKPVEVDETNRLISSQKVDGHGGVQSGG